MDNMQRRESTSHLILFLRAHLITLAVRIPGLSLIMLMFLCVFFSFLFFGFRAQVRSVVHFFLLLEAHSMQNDQNESNSLFGFAFDNFQHSVDLLLLFYFLTLCHIQRTFHFLGLHKTFSTISQHQNEMHESKYITHICSKKQYHLTNVKKK